MVTAPPSASKPRTPFEDFLLAEYQNLAQAHFNTINTISEFFKQYLLIVSIPVSVAVVFLKPAELKTSGILDYLRIHPNLPLALFNLIALAGFLVLGYVVNLRFDALLYARSINGLRKSFYKASGLNIEDELRFRVLPIWTHFPRYIERSHFMFVVMAFGLISTTYFYAGLRFYMWALDWPTRYSHALLTFAAVSCFSLHVLLYWGLGRFREREYLHRRIIGVDIDGVLNKHREHFCKILESETGKQLRPEKIVRIPVNESPGSGVTLGDEHAVFNLPEYWIDMPAADDAARILRRLRNSFGYKVWIFTHRGWPQSASFPKGREEVYWKKWRKVSWLMWPARLGIVQWIEQLMTRWLHLEAPVSGRAIRKITKRWLKKNGFEWDKLVIEKGNTDTRDALGNTRNRFISCQEKKIRLFVEDDPNKADKLADLCDIVFIPDHPYNQVTDPPNNMVRIKLWPEIEKFLRRIS